MLARLGFGGRKKSAARKRRSLAAEPLEARELLSVTLYWDPNGKTFANGGGGNGNWDTTSLCWSTKAAGGGTLAAWTNGDNATFGGTAGTVSVAATVNAGTITFNTTGYALQGSTLSLPGTTSVNVASGDTATIAAAISGSGGLKASGSGELIVGGANTYSGGTTVTAGTLQVGNTTALGSGFLAVNAGGTLDLDANSISVGQLSGGGTITDSSTSPGPTTLTVNEAVGTTFSGVIEDGPACALALTEAGTKTLTLTGANAFSGGTVIDNGATMVLANPSAAALQGNIQIGNAASGVAALQMGAADQFGANSVITMDGSSANWTYFRLMGYDQTVAGISDGTGAGIIENTQTTTGVGGAVLTIDNTANFSYDGYLRDTATGSGTLSVVTMGTGSLSFSGTHITYSGGTTITAGTLQAASGTALGAASGSLTMSGGMLDLDGNNVTVGTLSGSGGEITDNALSNPSTLTVNQAVNSSYAGLIADGASAVALTTSGSGTLTLSGANAYSGGTTINAGTLQVGNTTAPGSGFLAVDAGGTLDLDGNSIGVGQLSGGGTITDSGTTAGTSTLTVNEAAATTFSGTIEDGANRSLGLEEAGTKALTLTGANAFSGGTVIDNGSTMILANPSGAALQGNIQIGNGTSSGWAYLEMGAADQFGATSVITMDGSAANWAILELTGYDQTVAGISDGTGAGIIEITQTTSGIGPATLTVNNTADFSYNGHIRDNVSGGSGALGLVESGSGTLTLSGNAFSNTGTIEIQNGTLQAANGMTLGGGTVQIDPAGTLDMNGYAVTVNTLTGSGTLATADVDDPEPLTVNTDASGFVGVMTGNGQRVGFLPGAVKLVFPAPAAFTADVPDYVYQSNGLTWDYSGGDSTRPIVWVDYELPETGTLPDYLKVTLNFDGIVSAPEYFSTAGFDAGDKVRVAAQVDASSLPTGVYQYTLYVQECYDGGSPGATGTFTGTQTIVNRTQSAFGSGWWLDNLYQLFPGTGGAMLVTGDGNTGWFSGTSGTFTPPQETLDKLVKNSNGSCTLSDPSGEHWNFNSNGLLIDYFDASQCETTFAYNGAGLLSSMTDPLGHTTTFQYTAGQLSSVTDFAGRVSWFNNVGGEVMSITAPDPNVLGGTGGPLTQFQYGTDGDLTQVTDPDGNITGYGYDFADQQVSMTTPAGTTTTAYAEEADLLNPGGGVGWDQRDLAPLTASTAVRTIITDPLGHTTKYYYAPETENSGVNTTIEWDAVGDKWVVTVNTSGLVTQTVEPGIDSNGNACQWTTTYSYDTRGNLLAEHFADGTTESWTYDAYNHVTSQTDQDGNVTDYSYSYEFTPQGYAMIVAMTETQVNPGGANRVTQFTYSDGTGGLPPGLLLSETDPLGVVTQYTYGSNPTQGSFGKVTSLTSAYGTANATTVNYQYDAEGDETVLIDPLGRETAYTYDYLGRVTSVIRTAPSGSGMVTVDTYQYDADGNEIAVTDALGNETQYVYAWDGQVLKEIDPAVNGASPTTTYTYNADMDLTKVTDPLGNVTTYTYDALGREIKEIDAKINGSAPTTVYTCDAEGDVLTETDPLGSVTSYVYDSQQRLISQTDADGDTTTYTYDSDGHMLSLTDPDGNVTTWSYDAFGEQVSETTASGTESFVYNADRELVQKTDFDGQTTTYSYNNLGEETAENWLDSSSNVIHTFSYTYDADGELLTASDPAASYAYSYDAMGRITTITENIAGLAPTIVLSQQFDLDGNRTQFSSTIGDSADFLDSYTYNALGEMTQVTQSGVSGGDAVATELVTFTYNADGQFSAISRYADLAGTQLVVQAGYGYNAVGDLTSLTYSQGSTTLDSYAYTYNQDSQVTELISLLDGTASYTYDATGQVTGVTYTGAQAAESYSYDSNGNRTNTGYTTGANNELLSDGTYNYTYDANGNCTSRTAISNAPSSDYTTLYTWDYRNRLTSVTFKDNNGNVTQTVTYTYDVWNRLVGETVSIPGQDAQNTVFVYSGAYAFLQFDGSGSGALGASNLSHRYLWGPAVDQLLADEQITTPGQAGTVVWPLTDVQGTVRDLAVYNSTSNTTTIANHLVYDSFGNLTSQTNAAVDCLFGYTGQMYDKATGQYNNRARWYDPATGRFLNQDPSGFFLSGDPNLYRYVENSSPNFVDPFGLCNQGATGSNSGQQGGQQGGNKGGGGTGGTNGGTGGTNGGTGGTNGGTGGTNGGKWGPFGWPPAFRLPWEPPFPGPIPPMPPGSKPPPAAPPGPSIGPTTPENDRARQQQQQDEDNQKYWSSPRVGGEPHQGENYQNQGPITGGPGVTGPAK